MAYSLSSLTNKQMVVVCLSLLTTSQLHVVCMSPLYSFSPFLSLSLSLFPLFLSFSISLFTEIISGWLWHLVCMSPLYSFSSLPLSHSLSLYLFPFFLSFYISFFTEITRNLSLFRHSWLIMAWCGWGRNLTRPQPSTQTNCHQTAKRRRRQKRRRKMSGDQVCIIPSAVSVYTINVIITLYVSYQYWY